MTSSEHKDHAASPAGRRGKGHFFPKQFTPSASGRLLTAAVLAATLLLPGTFVRAESTAPQALRKIRDVVIHSDPRFHSAFPSVVLRPDGEILCAFRRAPSRRHLWSAKHDSHTDPNSYLMLVRSRDGGETWTTTPELLYAHAFGGSQDPCMLQLRDGSILCTSYGWALPPPEWVKATTETFCHPPFAFLGGYNLRSVDGGRTWEGPLTPPMVPGNVSRSALEEPLPAYNRGALAEGPDGSIFWAVARHDSLKPLRTSVHLMHSGDGGRFWNYMAPIAAHPSISFNETSLIRTTDGKLAAFLRTEGAGGKAAMAVSEDGGKSFGPWEDLGFVGLPLQATPLSGNRLLLVYGYRKAPYGIRARVVAGDLSDVKTAPEFILRDDGGGGDLGYPWAIQLPNGRILVVYYMNISDGPRHIAATLLETTP